MVTKKTVFYNNTKQMKFRKNVCKIHQLSNLHDQNVIRLPSCMCYLKQTELAMGGEIHIRKFQVKVFRTVMPCSVVGYRCVRGPCYMVSWTQSHWSETLLPWKPQNSYQDISIWEHFKAPP